LIAARLASSLTRDIGGGGMPGQGMRLACVAATLFGAVLAIDPAAAQPGAWRESLHQVPVTDGAGATKAIVMRVCRPAGEAPAPLAVVNHGSPPRAAARAAMEASTCDREAVAWFLRRGFVVALPLRRGYGPSGGAWAEAFGPCHSPDYLAAGSETARDIAAAMAHARGLPFVRADGTILVGQSAGGWGVLALASQRPAGVAAVVNMAGGRGGRAGGVPNANCRPERLVADAGRMGTPAAAPSLWIYTANDSFFGPALAAGMHRAHAAAGGRAEMAALPAFGRDGHGLFFAEGGSEVWGPLVERFLAAR
jgi:pimeloyl-ACP methyl ester carboxylesterase